MTSRCEAKKVTSTQGEDAGRGAEDQREEHEGGAIWNSYRAPSCFHQVHLAWPVGPSDGEEEDDSLGLANDNDDDVTRSPPTKEVTYYLEPKEEEFHIRILSNFGKDREDDICIRCEEC